MSAQQKALFLDRDGVINVNHGYVHSIDEFDFIPGIFDLCLAAQQRGYLIIIATNQSGIARGYYTEEQFAELMDWVKAQFKQHDITITDVFYCPYHLDAKLDQYRQDSDRRKPKPGMLLDAKEQYDLDMQASIFIGDKAHDMTAGEAAGVGRNILFTADEFDLDFIEDCFST